MRVTYTVCISRALSSNSPPFLAFTVRESVIRLLTPTSNDARQIAERIVNHRGIRQVPPVQVSGAFRLRFARCYSWHDRTNPNP